MNMNQSYSFQLEQKTQLAMIQALQICGGATQSIFPQVEAILNNSNDYQNALEFVSRRKKTDNYLSVIDFIFCELHPEWKNSCRLYYSGKGPKLKDLITTDQLVKYNNRLLKAIEVAYELFCEQRCNSWVYYKHKFEEAYKMAA